MEKPISAVSQQVHVVIPFCSTFACSNTSSVRINEYVMKNENFKAYGSCTASFVMVGLTCISSKIKKKLYWNNYYYRVKRLEFLFVRRNQRRKKIRTYGMMNVFILQQRLTLSITYYGLLQHDCARLKLLSAKKRHTIALHKSI